MQTSDSKRTVQPDDFMFNHVVNPTIMLTFCGIEDAEELRTWEPNLPMCESCEQSFHIHLSCK